MLSHDESSESSPFSLAYLARHVFEDGHAYRGGLLVVNERGQPLEFRCTSPIRPNAVQSTLYGESLHPYMALELVGKPLLGTAREGFNLLLVREEWFLNLRETSDTAVVLLRRQGEQLSGRGAEDAASLVDSPKGRFDPLVVTSFSSAGDDVNVALPLLEICARYFDPLEPFDRVERALEKVHDDQTLEDR